MKNNRTTRQAPTLQKALSLFLGVFTASFVVMLVVLAVYGVYPFDWVAWATPETVEDGRTRLYVQFLMALSLAVSSAAVYVVVYEVQYGLQERRQRAREWAKELEGKEEERGRGVS